MLDNVANKFFKGNKNVAFIVIAAGGMVLFILLIVLIASLTSGVIKSYSQLEDKLVNAAEKYYKDNSDKLPLTDGTVSVTDSTLVEGNYIKELSKLYSKDKCTATVEVVKNGDDYLYNPILKCDNYNTKTLYSELTQNVVTSDSGLYSVGNEYIFKGEYINNYVKFDGKTWRIVKIDDNGIKMYLINEKLEKTVWDDRYNLEKETDYGKNVYDTSRISVYLKEMYEKNSVVSAKLKKYLVDATWCVDSIKEGTLISNINLCGKTMKSHIGLLNVDDYAKASLESTCKHFDDPQCVNYNYMNELGGTNWTLNAYSENTYDVYAIDENGIYYYKASKENEIRPVIYLNSHLTISSGDGSEAEPYVIK